MTRARVGAVWGLIGLACLVTAALAEGEPPTAALMAPAMQNVAAGEVAKRTQVLRELLSGYYQLLPPDKVEAAEGRATSAGCSGAEACMTQVRQDLGVDVVYHLYIEDQGYVDPVYLTHLGGAGIVRQYTQCNRCTRRLYRKMLEELLRATHDP